MIDDRAMYSIMNETDDIQTITALGVECHLGPGPHLAWLTPNERLAIDDLKGLSVISSGETAVRA